MTRRFKKKPIVVEAFQLGIDALPEWITNELNVSIWLKADKHGFLSNLRITTLEGEMLANKGDYVIQGIQGEIYPCKAEIFEATYEDSDGNPR